MNIPERPKSILARATVSLLCLWIAASVAFVLFNRYSNGSDWDGLVDLLLLAVGCPVAFASLGIAGWSAGRRASLVILFGALACITLVIGSSIYDKHKTAQISIRRQAAHQAEIEAKYGAKCKKEQNTDNPYDYLLCLDDQERNDPTNR
jgi:hypothetical protein